jgi:CheY-like chemotaxis protein
MPSDAGILIVDDHRDTRYALESALAPLGHRLCCVAGGDEALKEVLRGRVGLVLLDVCMPDVSGLDVVRYLRRLEQTQHIPVVLLTGFGLDPALTSAAFELGVADLLPKPVDPGSLRTKVRYLYDAHQRRLALEREVRGLRALVEAGAAPGPRPDDQRTAAATLPRPDARVPTQRDAARRDAERRDTVRRDPGAHPAAPAVAPEGT